MFATPRAQYPLEALATAFEAENPGVDVTYTFGSKEDLAARLQKGEKADMVVDYPEYVKEIGAQPLAGSTAVPVGEDHLQIVVPKGNPKGVKDLKAFGDRSLRTGLCDPNGYFLCGRAGRELLTTQGVDAQPAATEIVPATLLDKVSAGQLDAALMFRTDVGARAGEFTTIDLIDPPAPVVPYELVRTRSSTPAVQFAQFVQSSENANNTLTAVGLRPAANVPNAPAGG